ncbi:hypothetical protein QTI33_10450 [Variovorax sp. J22P271]|uniref:DUF6036 family nucleotidyltransferase n=1 Tax=Variovorax davisae TaxID=3053515 RepID=UPI0025769D34|nr:DUF6036 family nucleotidyltransferase [Variovorax sp. J22P271]MDM0032544.1 hypothetical protein [Variovorax sp. J22P271]
MKLDELKHVLRASAAIADENSMVVVGSQAILLLLDEPPESLLVSREVDLYPALHPERADLIDGAIGMHSSFHDTFGYFADGVGPETAVMPADWMKRASLHDVGEVTAICPDLHDLAVSKCVAGRDKDADFVRELLRGGYITVETLKERIAMLEATRYPLTHIQQWVERRRIEAKASP